MTRRCDYCMTGTGLYMGHAPGRRACVDCWTADVDGTRPFDAPRLPLEQLPVRPWDAVLDLVAP